MGVQMLVLQRQQRPESGQGVPEAGAKQTRSVVLTHGVVQGPCRASTAEAAWWVSDRHEAQDKLDHVGDLPAIAGEDDEDLLRKIDRRGDFQEGEAAEGREP